MSRPIAAPRPEAMTNMPVWVYLAELRALRGVSQGAVAEALGVQRLTWGQIERGKTKEPSAAILIGAFRFLRGSWSHMTELTDATATAALARRLARQRIDEEREGGISALAGTLSQREVTSTLRELEAELTRSAVGLPRLAELLRRYIPPADERED